MRIGIRHVLEHAVNGASNITCMHTLLGYLFGGHQLRSPCSGQTCNLHPSSDFRPCHPRRPCRRRPLHAGACWQPRLPQQLPLPVAKQPRARCQPFPVKPSQVTRQRSKPISQQHMQPVPQNACSLVEAVDKFRPRA